MHSGLPPSHPLVAQQGFDPELVEASIRRDAEEIVAAGYNLRGATYSIRQSWVTTANTAVVVLMGPDQGIEVLEQQMRGVRWDGTGVGYGVRGARLPELTVRFEGKSIHRATICKSLTCNATDMISLYRKTAPKAPIMFNYSPDSALWAISRKFPLAGNCTNKPGKNLVSFPCSAVDGARY